MAENEDIKVDNTTEAPEKPIVKKKKAKRVVAIGVVHVKSNFNNTIISISDEKGNVIASSSSGACGFRGSKKGTAYASQVATEKAGQIAKNTYGLSSVKVYLSGIGLGRDAAVRSIANLNIEVTDIIDVTGIPHGGVRPKKARRV